MADRIHLGEEPAEEPAEEPVHDIADLFEEPIEEAPVAKADKLRQIEDLLRRG